jgi:hypothetical protein
LPMPIEGIHSSPVGGCIGTRAVVEAVRVHRSRCPGVVFGNFAAAWPRNG